jgi:hypothetical protein
MKTSVYLLIFFISINAFAGALYGLGVDEHLGVSPDPGGSAELEQAVSDAQEIQAGGGGGETLFSAYNSLASGIEQVLWTVLPAARLLGNTPIPNPIVDWLFASVPVVVALDYAGFFRGVFIS